MTQVASSLDEELLSKVDQARLPRHIAIIMDGNRRWAEREGYPIPVGHAEGVNALYRTVQAAAELGIETLTVFGFSTENWLREVQEVEALVQLVGDSAIKFREKLCEENVRMETIGNLGQFPAEVREALEETCEATKHCTRMTLVLAVSYGGRNDIVRACQQFAREVEAGRAKAEDLSETLLNSYLDTGRWCDPHMVVRTSGEQRLSNFLLWPSSYSEIIVRDTLWPDFGANDLLSVVLEYQGRERRHGN